MDDAPRADPVGVPTVVLVDDSHEVRALICRLLESTGFDVVGQGGDGDEAIILAYRYEPDLLLLDTSMPKADGIEALPAIIALSPLTRVVMFTGFEEPALAARARELGAADFVEKSLPLDELPARLMRTLRESPPRTTDTVPTAAALDDAPRARPRAATGPAPGEDLDEQAVLNAHVQEFRELFDRAEIGMATLTSSGTVVRANAALAGMMSTTAGELVGVDYGRLTVGRGDELDR